MKEESSEQGRTEVEKTENKIDEAGEQAADVATANKAEEAVEKVRKTG